MNAMAALPGLEFTQQNRLFGVGHIVGFDSSKTRMLDRFFRIFRVVFASRILGGSWSDRHLMGYNADPFLQTGVVHAALEEGQVVLTNHTGLRRLRDIHPTT